MFNHTLGVIDKTKSDIKRGVFIIQLCLYSFIAAVPLFRIIVQGNVALNLPLFLISLACLIFFILANTNKDVRFKKLLHFAKKFKRKFNAAILTLTLIISISGILFISASVLLTAVFILSIVGWITSLLFKLIAKFIEIRLEMFEEAIRMDLEPITSPVMNATNFVMEKLGKEPIEQKKLKYKSELEHLASVRKEKNTQARKEKRIERKKRLAEFKEKIKMRK